MAINLSGMFANLGSATAAMGESVKGEPLPTDPNQRDAMQRAGVTNPMLQMFGRGLGGAIGMDMRSNQQKASSALGESLTSGNWKQQMQAAKRLLDMGMTEQGTALFKIAQEGKAAEEAKAKEQQRFEAERLKEERDWAIKLADLDLKNKKYELDVKKANAPKDEKVSNYGLMLIEAGYQEGTPKYQAEMQKYITKMQKAETMQIKTLSPLEVRETLYSSLKDTTQFQAHSDAEAKLVKVDALNKQVQNGNSKAIRVLERSVSELYNSDSRAASEIDRFLTGKGITTTIGDYLTTLATGDVTDQTKREISEVVEAARRASTINKIQAVVNTATALGGNADVSDEAIASFMKSQGVKPLAEAPPAGTPNGIHKDNISGERVYVLNGVAYEL